MNDLILMNTERLRCMSSVVQGMKQQIIQLEKLLSESRKDLLKLKGGNHGN